MQAHPELKRDEDQLGVEGGRYDFSALDMTAKQAEYAAAVAEKDAKAMKVNKHVMSQFERAETEYKSLQERRVIVQKDRDTIMQVRVTQSPLSCLASIACCAACIAGCTRLQSDTCRHGTKLR